MRKPSQIFQRAKEIAEQSRTSGELAVFRAHIGALQSEIHDLCQILVELDERGFCDHTEITDISDDTCPGSPLQCDNCGMTVDEIELEREKELADEAWCAANPCEFAKLCGLR